MGVGGNRVERERELRRSRPNDDALTAIGSGPVEASIKRKFSAIGMF